MDAIQFEILEDGTISIKTDKISQTNHMSADELLQELEELVGGPVVRKKRTDVHAHAHRHSHKHVHA